MMEDISEVIPRQFLNCKLCNEEFQEPKLLPCLHSFCRRCIASYRRNNHHAQHLDGHTEGDTGEKFACPECGTEVPTEELEQLPDNVLARRLSCPSLTATPRDAAFCASCGQQGRGEVPAAVHCANCEETLCPACANAHSLQVETTSHKVEPLKSFQSSTDHKGQGGGADGEGREGKAGRLAHTDSGDSLTAGLHKCCQCYDSYDIDAMFCVDCDLALCADCHAAHDGSHRCAELSAIAQNFTAKIQEPVEDLRRDWQTLARLIANLDRADRYASKQHRDVERRVKRRTRILCSLIKEYESVLLQELDRRNQKNANAIQQRKVSATQRAASISAVTELTDKLLQFGSEEEKVALRRKVGRRVRELCETDLPANPLELNHVMLHEPSVTVETICNLFGELRTDIVQPGMKRKPLSSSMSVDTGMRSSSLSESIEENMTELTELEEEEEEGDEGGDSQGHSTGFLSSSDRSDILNAEKRKAMQNGSAQTKSESRRRRHSDSGLTREQRPAPRTTHRHSTHKSPLERQGYSIDIGGLDHQQLAADDLADTSNSSFQSSGSAQDNIPTQLLEAPRKEVILPEVITKDNIKGVGVNSQGDIIVATVSASAGASHKSAIYILEQHGIVRGQIPVSPNWNVHCVTADGKVAMIVARGDNRFKVKVLSEDGLGSVLADVHLESLGVNFATATNTGSLLVSSNRYTTLGSHGGKAARSGGNVAVYDSSGRLEKRFTNEDLDAKGSKLLEKPHWIAMDHHNNIFVADPGSHCVVGLTLNGELLFRLGNSDIQGGEELYQGPDSVCVDRHGHVIVTDKKEGRIDILNYHGQLLKSLFPSEPVRCVCATPDKLLLVVPTEGNFKLYDYM